MNNFAFFAPVLVFLEDYRDYKAMERDFREGLTNEDTYLWQLMNHSMSNPREAI